MISSDMAVKLSAKTLKQRKKPECIAKVLFNYMAT